jgi:hypothetical protein
LGQADFRGRDPDQVTAVQPRGSREDSIAAASAFPAAGRRYVASFPDFRFVLEFHSGSTLTWQQLDAEGRRGRFETVAIRVEPIVDYIFLVSWQEANGTTVAAVQDYSRGMVLTNITRTDGSFVQARGSLVELLETSRQGPADAGGFEDTRASPFGAPPGTTS